MGGMRKWGVGQLSIRILAAGDRQALPAGLLPAPPASPALGRHLGKGLSAGTWAGLSGDASILLIPGHAGACQHPRTPPAPGSGGSQLKPNSKIWDNLTHLG